MAGTGRDRSPRAVTPECGTAEDPAVTAGAGLPDGPGDTRWRRPGGVGPSEPAAVSR